MQSKLYAVTCFRSSGSTTNKTIDFNFITYQFIIQFVLKNQTNVRHFHLNFFVSICQMCVERKHVAVNHFSFNPYVNIQLFVISRKVCVIWELIRSLTAHYKRICESVCYCEYTQ